MKTIRFGILMFAVLASAVSFAAARDGKKSSAANAAAAKIEEWKREVKKLEAAPVAESFVKWTGLDTIKGTKNARWLSPSDLRGRFVVIVELDKEKVVEQFKAAVQLRRLGFVPEWGRDWEFTTVNRDVIVVYNVHDLSDEDLEKKLYADENLKGLEQLGYNFYGNITFEGAPDSATERPYVYVMAPEGKEPIYKSRIVQGKTQCVREAKEAIAKAAAELPAWRPWYGYVGEVKYTKGFDAAVSGGKGLAPFLQVLKKGIVSKKPEVAAESQRLFDALEQRKADLLWQIKKEWSEGPCAASYDMDELTKRFPAARREIASFDEKVAKAHPNLSTVYKHYALYRRCADPSFQAKSASAAKKLAAELAKAKPTLIKMSEDNKDVALQNVALSLLQRMDEVIEELPTKVMQK